ncbi:RDD family protein [Heyndrickxia coagulans]|uniref:RDD family protein n=1 Tax=Heyndrickxia coagulans TaxID=1398 RepID=UPI002E21E8C7|nr:RDD family protein [Heyndrickxia coagulans]
MNSNENHIPETLTKAPEQISGSLSGACYAGFWIRFWAYLLDLLVVQSVKWLVIHPIFRLSGLSLTDEKIYSPITIASALVFYGYFVLMTKFFGQTLGKMVFGLRVVPLNHPGPLKWSTVLFREWIVRYVCVKIAVIYIVVAFTPKKQGVHDLFADTAVIHERSHEPVYPYYEPA